MFDTVELLYMETSRCLKQFEKGSLKYVNLKTLVAHNKPGIWDICSNCLHQERFPLADFIQLSWQQLLPALSDQGK